MKAEKTENQKQENQKQEITDQLTQELKEWGCDPGYNLHYTTDSGYTLEGFDVEMDAEEITRIRELFQQQNPLSEQERQAFDQAVGTLTEDQWMLENPKIVLDLMTGKDKKLEKEVVVDGEYTPIFTENIRTL